MSCLASYLLALFGRQDLGDQRLGPDPDIGHPLPEFSEQAAGVLVAASRAVDQE